MKYKLKDICTIEKGKTAISKAKDGDYPLITTAETFKSSDIYNFDCKAVCIPLVSSTGHGHASINRLHYYEGKFALGTILARVTSNQESLLMTEYLYIYLSFFKDEILVPLMRGSANVSLTINSIKSIEIDIPDLSFQKRIIRRIKSISPLISQLKQENVSMMKEVKTVRERILELGIKGKLIDTADNSDYYNIKNEILSIENNELIHEDEKAFILPEKWEWVRLQDVTKLITCGYASTPQYVDKGKMFLSAKNVKPYKFMPDDHKYISEELYNKLTKNAKPEVDDILLTRVGAGIGECAIIDQPLDFAIYVSLTLIKPIKKLIHPKFLLHWLNSPEGVSKSLENIYGKGSSQGNLNVQKVRNFVIALPPIRDQIKIVSKIDELLLICNELENCLQENQNSIDKLNYVILKDELKKLMGH